MHVRDRYEGFIWWTMDLVGVTESVRWKVLFAVGVQFVVSILQMAVPLLFSGIGRIVASASLFALAALAFANTVLVVERDIVEPITGLHEAATCIAHGDLDADLPPVRQPDEIGQLVRGFGEMCAHLDLVARQAEVLADHDFEADVLEEEIPGRFGDSLHRMTASLCRYIDRIEADRDRFLLLNHLVSHDIPNIVNIIYGRLDQIAALSTDDAIDEHVAVVDEQIEEIVTISDTVEKLASHEEAAVLDLQPLLQREIQRVRDSFPDATVTADLPGGDLRVQGNELLSSVFANLITNGIEHNDAASPTVDVTVTRSNGHVEVAVADDGPGLEFDDAETFFETRRPGTGLNIVYTAVRQFGGSIDVTTNDDGGSTVTVELPRPTERVPGPVQTD
ncbi:ATP-binding protein [Haloarculaceae archaeon H-GB11]|nr:ATP-binding protein [Haloarculaceae archaeon H-GB11]